MISLKVMTTCINNWESSHGNPFLTQTLDVNIGKTCCFLTLLQMSRNKNEYKGGEKSDLTRIYQGVNSNSFESSLKNS